MLIGDTPKDIEAGMTAGVHVIGVASGKSNTNDLKNAGATLVLPDLTDPQLVQRSIWASSSARS